MMAKKRTIATKWMIEKKNNDSEEMHYGEEMNDSEEKMMVISVPK